ncbi:HAD family hydrolase [Selenomonas sp. CM52]|uniref:HAD family hydrolase n=1 Tax=Selenomonas sp. CM52 TaxID=936381 RepID=UPI00027C3CD6|nr:HAD family hydrolase [Selenomonas sp. CM52]EJU27147.1 putative phosphoglycolate phosphatase, bacterial [Selenomonas sp. CM52]
MQYKAVIFDLDGTLVDSLADLSDSVNLMLESYGFPTHEMEKYRYFVGNGSKKLMERTLPRDKAASAEFVEEALVKYKAIYKERLLEKTRPYNGVRELLAELKSRGIPLAVCTNKHNDAALTIVKILFAPGTFEEVLGDRPGFPKKPNPATPLEIASHLGVKPDEVAYLGDTSVDMETAVHAGFLPVGVLWGFRPEEELVKSGAKVLLKAPLELLEKVEF